MGLTSKLSGAEVKRLQDALLAAFPTRSALVQMVRVGLEENLEAIASQENLNVSIFELIRWAAAQGRLDELVAAAWRTNPGNPELDAFAEDWGRPVQDGGGEVPKPKSPPSVGPNGAVLKDTRREGVPGRSAGAPGQQVDALLITAVKDEWDAVLAVDTGAKPGSTWGPRPGAAGPEVFYRSFAADSGGELRLAVVQAFGMGREQAVIAAAPLLERYPEIRCLAMCGVCAGRRGDVALGDVIIADRTWPYDAGKLKTTVDDQAHPTERFQGDMDLYRIHPPEWKQRAERFQPDPAAAWIKERPRSYDEQGDWVMERLATSEDPVKHPDRPAKCPDWAKVLEQLWKVKRLEDGEAKLTEVGRAHIRRRMITEPDGLREPGPFKVVVGPIASGAPVVQDPTIFNRLSDSAAMRKVVGLEMETSAILALAYLRKVPHAIVMKGVMDHADAFKSDNMKPFAARASAECLIGFLREHLEPHRAVHAIETPRSAPASAGGVFDAAPPPDARYFQQSDDSSLVNGASAPGGVCTLLFPGATAAYLLYVARDRVATLFPLVDPATLAAAADRQRQLLPFGEPGAVTSESHARAAAVRQLAAVVQHLEKTARLSDLCRIVREHGKLDADWYEVRADFRAQAWNPDSTNVILRAPLPPYQLELSCSKRNIAGVVEERGVLLPTSTSALLFDGRSNVPLRGLIRLGAIDRDAKVLRGTALFLILESLYEQI